MLGALAKKIFGSANDRRIKAYRPKVAAINALESEIQSLSDEALRARTDMLKAERSASATSTSSSSAAWCCMRAASPR